MSVYAPNRANRPTSFTLPADAESVRVASVNPAFQGLADVLAWLRYGSIENWSRVAVAFGPADFGANSLAVDPVNGWYWAVGQTSSAPGIFYSPDGKTWTDDTSNLPGSTDDFAAIAGAFGTATAGNMIAAGINGHYVVRNAAGVYSRVAITGSSNASINKILYDPANVGFLLMGTTNPSGGNPAVWSVHLATGAQTALTLTNAASHGGTAIVFAAYGVGAPRYVAITNGPRIWDTDSIANPWTDRGAAPFSSSVRGIAWNPNTSLYMVTTSDGNVYTSTDGIAWSLITNIAATFVPSQDCLTYFDGAFVTVGILQSAPTKAAIFYSIDGGLTWGDPVPYPDSVVAPVGISQGNHCLALLSGVSGAHPDLSLSVRT